MPNDAMTNDGYRMLAGVPRFDGFGVSGEGWSFAICH
jgi:hypothetical protein